MTNIADLIKKHCPDGVEFKELGDIIFSLKTGLNPRKNFTLNTEDAKNYYVTVRELNGMRVVFHNKTDRVNDVALKLINNRSNLESGDILFSGTGTVGRTAIIKENPINWNIKEGIYTIKPNQKIILPLFLLYYLNSQNANIAIETKIVGSPVCSIPMVELKKIKIPIPPIEVQQEIVKILDTFTQLEAELEAELEARNKQYEHYRNALLSFEDKTRQDQVKWVTLGQVSSYSQTRIHATELTSESYIGVDNLLQDKKGKTISAYVPTSGSCIKYETGDILIGNIRPYLKKIWKAENNGGTNGDVLVVNINEKSKNMIIPSFLYYVLSADAFFDFNVQFSKGAKMPRGDKNAIMKYMLPLPSLDEQKKIVVILDKFDKLAHDINEGLPVEIDARRKQYEYYRNKLLTFKEATV